MKRKMSDGAAAAESPSVASNDGLCNAFEMFVARLHTIEDAILARIDTVKDTILARIDTFEETQQWLLERARNDDERSFEDIDGIIHCGRPVTIVRSWVNLLAAGHWAKADDILDRMVDERVILRVLEANRSVLLETWGEEVATRLVAEARAAATAALIGDEDRDDLSCEELGVTPVSHMLGTRAALERVVQTRMGDGWKAKLRLRGDSVYFKAPEAGATTRYIMAVLDGVADILGVPRATGNVDLTEIGCCAKLTMAHDEFQYDGEDEDDIVVFTDFWRELPMVNREEALRELRGDSRHRFYKHFGFKLEDAEGWEKVSNEIEAVVAA